MEYENGNICQLMLLVTLDCTSRCAHCCLSAGEISRGERLLAADMKGYIKDAHDIGIDNVGFTGGEPTLYLDDLCDAMSFAASLGMFVDVRTNAFWAETEDKASDMITRMQEYGMRQIGFSYDVYHAEYICLEYIVRAVKIVEQLGIAHYIDWIGLQTREHVCNYLQITDTELRAVCHPIKLGRAKGLHRDDFRWISIEELEQYKPGCMRNLEPHILAVFPDKCASLHQCCWVNPALVKNISGNGWIYRLWEETAQDKAAQFLRDYGIGGLIRKAREEAPELLRPYYSDGCEVCYDLLPMVVSNDKKTKIATVAGVSE